MHDDAPVVGLPAVDGGRLPDDVDEAQEAARVRLEERREGRIRALQAEHGRGAVERVGEGARDALGHGAGDQVREEARCAGVPVLFLPHLPAVALAHWSPGR